MGGSFFYIKFVLKLCLGFGLVEKFEKKKKKVEKNRSSISKFSNYLITTKLKSLGYYALPSMRAAWHDSLVLGACGQTYTVLSCVTEGTHDENSLV